MRAKASHAGPRDDAERLLRLAKEAPPPQRSKLTPYLAVIFELRGKGYSYEKIADFLKEHTGREFTRSQVFAFLRRNSSVFGVTEAKIEDEEGEPLPSQLLWDHVHAVQEALPEGIDFEASFLPGEEGRRAKAQPKVSGLVAGKFHSCYRTRRAGRHPEPEWWNGKGWERVTPDLVRHAKAEVLEILDKRNGPGP